MSLASLSSALRTAGIKFDFIGFDACLMATVENARMLADYADYMIASEETEPGIGWYYTNWLTELSRNTSLPTLDIGKRITDDFVSTCASQCRGQSATLSVVDLAELSQTLSPEMSAFSQDMLEKIRSNNYRTVATARNNAREFAQSSVIDQIDFVDFAWKMDTSQGRALADVLLDADREKVTVRAAGDGQFYLRAVCRQEGKCVLISQTEFSAAGFGNPAVNPCSYVSAGLYDLHEGEIGSGNEKGIAFERGNRSMIGFRKVDFGRTGSDRITVDLFALSSDPFDLEMYTVGENGEEENHTQLHYDKPSIWNVYQAETWQLPRRLTGIQTLCFRMHDKVHMKGFVFEKQTGAWLNHTAGSADRIYGDLFRVDGSSVKDIGNNVTLTWEDMDFGGEEEVFLEVRGHTPLPVNTITVRIRNGQGNETTGLADYAGDGQAVQRFPIRVPAGNCSVSFVFLPGSAFDFDSFQFKKATELDRMSGIR